MKVNGIVAEYNPFHNGHAYQMQHAKEATGADYTIVVMSGNFMQRGAPALLDKFTRQNGFGMRCGSCAGTPHLLRCFECGIFCQGLCCSV